MSADNTPPDWAFSRVQILTEGYWDAQTAKTHKLSTAFARYIAEHEDPPVDPLLIEAREIVAIWFDENPERFRAMNGARIRAGEYDKDPTITQAIAALRRGIEIGPVSA